MDAVTDFTNNINLHPSHDTGSPRKYLYTKMCCNIKDQENTAKAKEKEEEEKKSQMKAMIKKIERAPPLFGPGNCLSASNFDVRKKISKADIARAEKEMKEVKAMQTVIPPTSDSVSSRASTALVEHMLLI